MVINKHQIFLGDYVENILEKYSGYVITIWYSGTIKYHILDLQNKESHVIEGNINEIVLENLNIVRNYFSTKLRVISRSMTHRFPYVCSYYCKYLKEFPEACEKYCPIRKINSNTFFVGKENNELKYSGFLPCEIKYPSEFESVFKLLAKALPKPDSRFKDLSEEGVVHILSNGDRYNLQSYIYYNKRLSDNKSLEGSDIFWAQNPTIPYFMKGDDTPCDYCIYENTDNCINCKIKDLCILI